MGYKSISSPNNFMSSLICDSCSLEMKFTKMSQAVWVLRRHTQETRHKVKAGWFLDEMGIVQSAKPKGEFQI